MSTRRAFLKTTIAAGATVLASAHADNSRQILDVGPIASNRRSRRALPRIKSVHRREETILRYRVHGDNWHMTWAADDRQYVNLCDGSGLAEVPREFHNSRIVIIDGEPRDATFSELATYPKLSRPSQSKSDTRYYNFGTVALDGQLFQFLSTFNRKIRPEETSGTDKSDPLRFNGAKLIYSPDMGRTWRNQDGSTPVRWESWEQRSRDTMVFFEEDQEAFSLISVLQMGRNYEHNRDGYIYGYSPNGNTDGTMNELVMFRVPKRQLLKRSSYEFFAGESGNEARWTKRITERAVVHTFPQGWVNRLLHPYAWQPSVSYCSALDTYLMANWGMGNGPDGTWFGKPSYLGFWISKYPWGPWTQIHEETAWQPNRDNNARAYQPQISPKWIAADGKSFWLVWTDFQVVDKEAEEATQEENKRNASIDTYSQEEVTRNAIRARQYRPYYAFNTQRVDLVF